MVTHTSFTDQKSIDLELKEHLEPDSTRRATERAIVILNAVYKGANLPQVIYSECSHLTIQQQRKLSGIFNSLGAIGVYIHHSFHIASCALV